MSTKFTDPETGEVTIYYDSNEKREYYWNRSKKSSGFGPMIRGMAIGWLKKDKEARKEFYKNNPNYVPKHKK